MCCPNLSVLKMGLRTPDNVPSLLSWPFEDDPEAADFIEGWCFCEKRSDVARGIPSYDDYVIEGSNSLL